MLILLFGEKLFPGSGEKKKKKKAREIKYINQKYAQCLILPY